MQEMDSQNFFLYWGGGGMGGGMGGCGCSPISLQSAKRLAPIAPPNIQNLLTPMELGLNNIWRDHEKQTFAGPRSAIGRAPDS